MTTAPAVEERPAFGTGVARQPRRPIRGFVNLAASALVSGAVLYVAFFPAGPLPALGPSFNPATGAWTMAADAQITDRTLPLAGLEQPVRVVLEPNGTAHVTAQTDHDLFLATGYVHARFRLFQMDLMRRQGAGRLSEIVGKVAVPTDTFELQLGLLRTAQAEWNALPAGDPSRLGLIAYAQGVNDRIAEAESMHQLDAMFTLLGYRPQPWTPIDSLLIKGDMTQTLNFTDTPLVMALLNKSLGADLTSEWFPVLPANQQSPYDTGPYNKAAPTPIAPVVTSSLVTDAAAQSVAAVYDRLAALPAGLLARGGESNNWAVAGAKSASGGALLAGDPHLHLTLPAIWFQLTMDSPGYHAAGVSIPGTPVILIGHNQHIAWSLTDAQNQQTFFYLEKEDASHPGMYSWNGAWKAYTTVAYDVPVLGGATQHVTVKLSVHGPVISERGQTTSVWWAGNVPSQDLGVLLRVGQASNWSEFRAALRDWYSPTHNFVYADDVGNIGLISAGYYPQVAKGQPWLPMPGTGESDVVGTIPYDDIPQAYNPPDHIIWSANQREVTADYPYYIGTASNFFDPGYRADEIHRVLSQPGKLTASDMAALQTDTRDFLASEIAPVLLKSLDGVKLNATETAAVDLLRSWDYRMDADSPGATIWAYFWGWYVGETFDPWWKSRAVHIDMGEVYDALGQDLEAWTLHDPGNRAFSAPGVGSRTAVDAQRTAFHRVIADLAKQLGSNPKSWTWGRVHTRVLENLAQIAGLNYGPRPDRGDAYTPLAARGLRSTEGPSWRMVVDWGSRTFQGVYPGGQSENPSSSWYTNRVDTWWKGSLDPMLSADDATGGSGVKTWSLHP
ncbi:MAG TPA: penicillin acylase family protein [Candidatus Limnocylindrales bacterium]|nr:penicillin acylase family protein [Candidatus Limnocylindrales bacterium]